MERVKNYSVFTFVARNAIKIGVSESFLETKSAPTLFTKRTFCSYPLCELNILVLGLGGGQNTHEIVTKRCKNRGFRDFEVVRNKAWNEGNWSVQKWPARARSIMGCLCCATYAPVFERIEGNPRWTLRCCGPHNWVAFIGEEAFFFFIFVRYSSQKTHSWTIGEKKTPKLNTTAYIYIYIYTYIHTCTYVYIIHINLSFHIYMHDT